MGQPIIPANLKNPTMTGPIQRRTQGNINRAARNISRRTLEVYTAIPRQRVDADSGVAINSNLPDDHYLHVNQTIIYEYQLSAEVLKQLSAEIDAIIRGEYLGRPFGEPFPSWYMYDAVDSAYEQGTALAVTNLNNISDDYNRSLFDVLRSDPYRARAALVRARVFENMEGLTASTRADLADTLARGMQAGDGPRKIAKSIRERTGVSRSRAERIARTEINAAHRGARRAEAKDAQNNLGIDLKLLHISALSPTTRVTHARRNGDLFTIQEVEQWYTVDGNAINCKCTQVETLVDSQGEATSTKLIAKLKEKGDKFFALHQDR